MDKMKCTRCLKEIPEEEVESVFCPPSSSDELIVFCKDCHFEYNLYLAAR
jgi:predicted RNA-binding Zn-ribbon protein involved in translation (DUF1610 family)